nr:DNA-dependent metalloprotease WSS1-like isoform X1 [Coffea arabica]
MNSADGNKVWEIRVMKTKPKQEEARKFLQKIAAQVQPIMQKHNWKVKLLSEFCQQNLLGLNIGGGQHVKLRLRSYYSDEEFFPYDEVLDTMLHELCHNVHGPHDAGFYRLWDELRRECEDLIRKGISGTGRPLGGIKPQPPLSFLRQTVLAAAETRVHPLLPSGPKRIGGDSSMMAALTPTQAAAMAAERRYRDNIWCGSESYDASENAEENNNQYSLNIVHSSKNPRDFGSFDGQILNVISRKRRRGLNGIASSSLSNNGHSKSKFLDLTTDADFESSREDLSSKTAPRSVCGSNPTRGSMWECGTCTLLNPQTALMCELCSSGKPKDVDGKRKFWSCKFCTLDNVVKMERCEACGEWR